MSLITISRGSFSGGKGFAEHLAKHLGYRCMSREELADEAVKAGVPVGRLQSAVVRPARNSERLGQLREFYLSFITSTLCRHALEGNLIYHGHTGHMLFPGIPHIFRVRVLANMDFRIATVMDRLNISREKAVEYIANVDVDRDKWVKYLFGINWYDPQLYDLIVNLDQMGVDNATSALCSMAELPDFRLTPVSRRALEDLYLSSYSRYLLGADKRTSHAAFKVTANSGVVQVTCMPQYSESAQYVQEILSPVKGCTRVHCTIAGSHLLWMGERFEAESELYRNVVKVAHKWDAAVELMYCASGGCSAGEDQHPADDSSAMRTIDHERDGGIEDDVVELYRADRESINPVLDALQKDGCSGGASTIYGDKEGLLATLGHRTNYSLIIIGDMFLSKSEKVRTRMTDEIRGLLTDNLKAPVVSSEELKRKLKLTTADYLKLAVLVIISIVMFAAIMTNQEYVLRLSAAPEYSGWRIPVIAGLVLFIPVFAYALGTSMRQLLRFLGME